MMQDYKKLVEALRCCAGVHTKPTKCPDYDDSWCSEECLDKHLIAAADAIEALQAAEPTEKQVVDYCHKRCLVVLDADLFHELKASYGKMPKRGEWIPGREIGKEYIYDKWITYYEGWHCSNCNVVFEQENKPKYNYCPNCGAKMEVQDG